MPKDLTEIPAHRMALGPVRVAATLYLNGDDLSEVPPAAPSLKKSIFANTQPE
ncbi:MAG: hypothetical protein WBK91_04105 [Alphaproteobacteria bacterium]